MSGVAEAVRAIRKPEAGPAPGPSATEAVRAGIGSDLQHGAVVPPLHLTSTFLFEDFDRPGRYDYTRTGNPTRELAAEAVAGLEEGVGAVLTSSGMAAVALVLHLLEPDDLLVAPEDGYGGCWRLMNALAKKGRFTVEFIDPRDPEVWSATTRRRPRMIWVETPSNPLLRLTDLRWAREAARASGALLVVDNTFLSPVLQRPIPLGADLVVHSTTKYLNGHSDVVGGAVVSARPELHEELGWWANALGLAGSPFDAWLTLRGIRTLHARMRVHEENARTVAARLAKHRAVTDVLYPGLPQHPGHDLALLQQDGFGAMVSFELRGGVPSVRAFLDGLEHFSLAESLGGVESLVAHPATMTHASMDAPARERAGISDALLRLSVGIESADDLVADLDRALERADAARGDR